MVIDTSAIVAIFLGEPERPSFVQAIYRSTVRLIAAPNVLEAEMVLMKLSGSQGLDKLQQFLTTFSIVVVPFDQEQTRIATAAFRAYGKGRHPARLNFGDCFAYALAKSRSERLLFKGNDFSQTDLLLA